MNILHIALGGCLKAPPISYGLTEDTGGHIAYVLGAAQAQAARGDRVTLVTRAFDDPHLGPDYARKEEQVAPRLVIRRLRTARTGYLAKEALNDELPALVEAFLEEIAPPARRPEVIHAHFADAAVLARAARERYGIPFVYTPHSLAIDKIAHLGAAVGPALQARIARETAAIREASAIVVSSRNEAERQLTAYDPEAEAQCFRIWPGVERVRVGGRAAREAEALIAGSFTRPERPLILAVARPVRRKNLLRLACLYAESPALQARANLMILAGQHGPGVTETQETAEVYDDLRAIAARRGLRGTMALPPRHAPDLVPALYDAARARGGVFASLALHEPFGLTILEAARHGLPVVATAEGGPPDILAAMQAGQTVAPDDARAIEAALCRALDDRDAWEGWSRAGTEGIARFSWDRWAADVAQVYAEVAASPPARALAAPALVLASDIDATLTGSARAARAFGQWRASSGAVFAVATGRALVEARRVLQDWSLPQPDAFITAVGTEVHLRDARGRWRLCEDYAETLLPGWDPRRLRRAIVTAGVTLQPEIEQRRWKLGALGTEACAARLSARLAAEGLSAQVVPSHGRLIDVLPVTGGKGAAVRHLARRLGVTAEDVVVAGDSGNDLDMLREAPRGILVGNALPELAPLIGAPNLYRARAHHAAGVLEGLNHFAGTEVRG